jgi:hypothetical protein
MSHTTSKIRRPGRVTAVAVSAVLALGVGIGVSACASSAGGSSSNDDVATANAEASKQADVAADTYQELSASITQARDLAAEATGKVADTSLLDTLTAATDTARAINPVSTYKPADDVDQAKAKLHDLEIAADQMNAAKTTLDAAITAVKAAEK